MSYCRWSTDDFKCDLYCYEDVHGGYTTMVASMKRVKSVPPLPSPLMSLKAFKQAIKVRDAYFERAELVPIRLPHDGEIFNDPDLESFKERLLHLREVGYHFPDSVLERVDAEIAEGQA